jgi:hypothetical protein
MNKSQKLLLETGKTKQYGLVLSGPTTVRGTIGSSEGILLPAKWHLTRGRVKIHDNSRSCGGG